MIVRAQEIKTLFRGVINMCNCPRKKTSRAKVCLRQDNLVPENPDPSYANFKNVKLSANNTYL